MPVASPRLSFEQDVADQCRAYVDRHAEEIAEAFYSELIEDPEASGFLDRQDVETRLKGSLARWLRDVFRALVEEEDLAEFLAGQRRVGEVHARINVTLTLVNRALRILKRALVRHPSFGETFAADRVAEVVTYLGDALDFAIDGVNRAYLQDLVTQGRYRESLRIVLTGHELALEVQRYRQGLLEWLAEVLLNGSEDGSSVTSLRAFHELGLSQWLSHKVDLVVTDAEEVEQLRGLAASVGQLSERARDFGGPERMALVRELYANVRKISDRLDVLVERSVSEEQGRDPLTRALSRRYLAAVLQRELAYCKKTGNLFALMMCDLDDFKAINDQHGHIAGDELLRTVAQSFLDRLRPGDFLFRYGGEEFLLLIPDTTPELACFVADQLRLRVQEERVSSAATELSVTISIGIAMYDGHPDYMRTVTKADTALRQAKQSGKNCVVLYEGE